MEITNRKQLKEFIDRGFTAEIYKLFGVFSCDFFPFENLMTSKEEENIGNWTDKEIAERLWKERISTVFNGVRFYFETHEQLKRFCEIAEKDEQRRCKIKKIFRFLAALFILFVISAWTLKGLEYLTEKTRQVRLDADYTEEMLRTYRD